MLMRTVFHTSGRAWWSCRPRAPQGVSRPIHPLRCPEAVDDGMITDLGLTIALRIVGHEKSVGNLILRTKAGDLLSVKVCPIVRDNGVGESEATTMFCHRNLIICCSVSSKSGTTSTYLVK